MMIMFRLITGAAVAAVFVAASPPADPQVARGTVACDALGALRLPDVRVTSVRHAAASTVATDPVHVPHCRLDGVIGTEIGLAVWLPDAWNGRFLMSGGGGYVGEIPSPGPAVDRGFAVTTTDTGHRSTGAVDARWALNEQERVVNFFYLATHRTAVTAKAIVAQYYAAEPKHSYFTGCSTSGRQALVEAQRFPEDFDALSAGAPQVDSVAHNASRIKNAQAAFPDPGVLDNPIVTPAALRVLENAMLQACDARDGLTDGLIEDPRDCPFDRSKVPVCTRGASGSDCLTAEQLAVIERIYAPLRDEHGLAYEGQPVGSEGQVGGWNDWITGSNPKLLAASGVPNSSWGFGVANFRFMYLSDPAWTYRGYDVARSWRRDTAAVAATSATNPDLSAFRARGGKLFIWHGWSDAGINPLATIRYYEEVLARDKTARADVRLFLLPGVEHCGGGPGPGEFDRIDPLVDWVEKGVAPDRITVTKRSGTAVVRTRPVCPYPAKALYNGSGSIDEAANFACR